MSSELKTNKISPATGTALQIGDSGDTITIPSGATLTNSGSATGFGKVLQVVSTFKGDTFSTGSSTYVTVTGLTATITPSATSSKILVLVHATGASSGGGGFFGLTRAIGGGSEANIGVGTAAGSRAVAWGEPRSQNAQAMNFLDSPSTTSACVYAVKIKTEGGAVTSYLGRSNSDTDSGGFGRYSSDITVMEIAG
jgi:hypothetical protein